ncbi:MAG TPA: exosortase system-associated protein, TIGR04073 family [Verrucomicrobiae bacterium]|nr:exosortase system-associated protein, TIGR04073 family [Verrucomicrobiae bacterium]
MRSATVFLSVLSIAAMFTAGCAGPEEKFGLGMDNTFEVVRMGEMRRSIEQTAIFDSPGEGYTVGFIRGLNRSLARTGMGVYELVTAPIPPYGPVFTNYFAPWPVYPDSYKPRLISDSTFDTDTFMGFPDGDAAPWFPGSRFNVFNN